MWNEWGFDALIAKHQALIENLITTYWDVKEASAEGNSPKDELLERMAKIQSQTGIKIQVYNDKIALNADGTDICSVPKEWGKFVLNDMIRTLNCPVCSSIVQLCDATGAKPTSRTNVERILIEIAAKIDRKDAFLRQCLPNLRKTAKHVVLTDRIAIAMATPDMIDRPISDRAEAFRADLIKGNYLKKPGDIGPWPGSMPGKSLRVGNVIIGRDAASKIRNGSITIKAGIPESVRHAITGREFGDLVENHICSTAGVKMKSIKPMNGYLIIETDSLDPQKLYPIALP